MFPSKRKQFRKFWNNVKKVEENNEDNYEISPCYGYLGFQLYFSDKEKNVAETLLNVKSFENYIDRNNTRFSFSQIKENRAFALDLKQVLSDDDFLNEWIDFKEKIIENTDYCLACLGLAMHQTIYSEEAKDDITGANILSLLTIHCRLINNEPVMKIKQLRVNSFGKLVSIRGTVIKASVIKLQCQQMAFSCSNCSHIQVVEQPDGVYTQPTSCRQKNCNARSNFVPQLSSLYTRTVNYQTVKLQDLVGDDAKDLGRVPRTVECALKNDLVRRCGPGDDVTITGVVKVPKESEISSKSKQPSVFLLYIEVVSIVNEKSSNNAIHSGTHFNQMDYYRIQQIHAEPGLFRFLVHSLCPKIYGHEIAKAGLLLVLFGGTKTNAFIRSDSHLLMVGDPGLGKSELLQACSNVAPRGVYVCGNTSTSSGLTVTLKKDSGSDYSLEAGALMLADQGCCCIDEFDKMGSQHKCLLEVMEQQSISIAKSGTSCTLTTRPSVIAAANPAGGHYNKAKTIAENLKLGSPLLSRFDVVFILLDQPNEESDLLLCEHILGLHRRRKTGLNCISTTDLQTSSQYAGTTLKDRLRLQQYETIDSLPHVLFRKYIAYAQKYVHPVLNRDAQKVVQQFYLQLRNNYHKADSTPVTHRQIESLVRLTQARAKLELREEATGEDAMDVVEIMRHSLADIFTDKIGNLDFTRSQNGSGISNKKQMTTFLKALQHKAEATSRSTFSIKEMMELSKQLGLSKGIQGIIDSLNIQGYIIKKGDRKFQLTI